MKAQLQYRRKDDSISWFATTDVPSHVSEDFAAGWADGWAQGKMITHRPLHNEIAVVVTEDDPEFIKIA